MSMRRSRSIWTTFLAALVCFLSQTAYAATKCTMDFKLSGWSAFYKRASGTGTIKCDNGQSATAALRIAGGGLTFGQTKVVNGRGTFSEVGSINELFGNYAVAEAHAGVGPSSDAQVMTKGNVSLALKGTGQGVNLGFDFGKFTISRPTAKKK
jgi:hypothetical protein